MHDCKVEPGLVIKYVHSLSSATRSKQQPLLHSHPTPVDPRELPLECLLMLCSSCAAQEREMQVLRQTISTVSALSSLLTECKLQLLCLNLTQDLQVDLQHECCLLRHR